MNALRKLIIGDAQADRVVPPSGFTAQLTLFVSGAMAFLCVFALALNSARPRPKRRSRSCARPPAWPMPAPSPRTNRPLCYSHGSGQEYRLIRCRCPNLSK